MDKREEIKLTDIDYEAIAMGDSGYINNKGAKLYEPDTYYKAVEYYRIGAAMGNDQSISNLGYCYLYGRDVEQNTSLAVAYLKIATSRGNVDAAYKLGDIYGRDKWGLEDKEKSIYYYTLAAGFILGQNYDGSQKIAWHFEFEEYPSLCFALARELLPGGSLNTDIEESYKFLKHAEMGYERTIDNGSKLYLKEYDSVLNLEKDSVYDDVRQVIDAFFNDELDEENYEDDE